MGHSSKVLMGNIADSFHVVDNHAGSIEAGLIVRLKSDDTISIAAADGSALGISLGKDLSDTAFTAIVRKGTSVPILLTGSFTPVIGAQVHISDTTGKAGTAGGGFTGMNATYKTGALTAMKEDGSEVASGCALIDMQGGL